jgi:hypothetical protein
VLESLAFYFIKAPLNINRSDFPAFCDINPPEVERLSVSCPVVAEEERRVAAEVCSLFPAARAAQVGKERNKADKKGRCSDLLDNRS